MASDIDVRHGEAYSADTVVPVEQDMDRADRILVGYRLDSL